MISGSLLSGSRREPTWRRLDFATVTRALRPEVDFRASYIIDDADWEKAPDHRPVLAIFK